jgi:hypothetical protein
MSISEKLMLTQTIVLAVQTIVMFLTGGIVVWYTYETLKIRKETTTQNALLADQIAVMRQALDFDSKKLAGEIDPVFDSPGCHLDGSSMKFRLPNIGGMAKSISVKPQDGFNLSVWPADILPKGRELTIALNVPTELRPKTLYFEIHYENRNGDKRVKAFQYLDRGRIKEVPLADA